MKTNSSIIFLKGRPIPIDTCRIFDAVRSLFRDVYLLRHAKRFDLRRNDTNRLRRNIASLLRDAKHDDEELVIDPPWRERVA